MAMKMRTLLPRLKSLLSVSLLSAVLLSGCSPLYLIRAAYEEGKILWRREPIETLLEKPDLDPESQEKFKLVLAVREYARDELKLSVGGSANPRHSFYPTPVATAAR